RWPCSRRNLLRRLRTPREGPFAQGMSGCGRANGGELKVGTRVFRSRMFSIACFEVRPPAVDPVRELCHSEATGRAVRTYAPRGGEGRGSDGCVGAAGESP